MLALESGCPRNLQNTAIEREVGMSMKSSRNGSCPCGSGKKYKRCCYLQEQSAVEAPILEENDEDDFWAEMYYRIRRLTLDSKAHIKEYYKIRKMHSEIVGSMIKYHEDGKFKQNADADFVFDTKSANEVYMLESEFDLDSREGAHGFYDMIIYKMSPNLSCITEDFINNRRYRKSEKIEFLQSMLDSRLGLFEVLKVDSAEGYAYIKEVFTDAEYKIIDVGLSGDENNGGFYLYTRIISYKGISFGTGLNLIFKKDDGFIENHIKYHKKDYNPNGEMFRFTQLYNRFSKNPGKIKIAANSL